MIYTGHLGSGLTLNATGPDALILICRPVGWATCSVVKLKNNAPPLFTVKGRLQSRSYSLNPVHPVNFRHSALQASARSMNTDGSARHSA